MSRIKLVAISVFALLILLAILSSRVSEESRENRLAIERITKQKAFTQEIAKSIFYIYQKRDTSSKILEDTIDNFLNGERIRVLYIKSKNTTKLWNSFYSKVSEFIKNRDLSTPYSSIVLDRLVNDIYTINLELILAFDRFIEDKNREYQRDIDTYKKIERSLFFIVISLLIYLFTQIREIISFIYKFSNRSKDIIEKSTIKGVTPISIESKEKKLQEITDNYNHLIEKINSSISDATKSISITTKSIEILEQNIESFMELVAVVENRDSDEIFKREDTVIDSLETLISLNDRLKRLERELKEYIKRV